MAVNKVPPHSDEAEKSVLGSILMDRDAIVQVSEILLPDYFYAEKHGDIYAAMLRLFEAREPIDLVTLPQKLKEMKLLTGVGGVAYLSSLVEGVPSSANIRHYGEIIQSYYTRRKLISDASSLIERSFDEGTAVTELLDNAEQKVFSLSQSNLKQGFQPIRAVLSESFDRLDELSKKSGSLRGVATGFADLDNCLAGMQDSNLIILAARPGMGKCVSGETWMVNPETGARVRMKNFVKEGKGNVLSLNGQMKVELRKPSIYLNDGVKKVWKIVTAFGNTLRATAVHPLLTLKGWKRVEELKIGDRVGLLRELPIFGNSSWEEYRVITLAYLLGDGGLTNVSPRFTNGSSRVRDDFEKNARQFEDVQVKNIASSGRTQSVGVIRDKTKQNSLTLWLRELGLMGKGALEKSIPEQVFELNKHKMALFLNRLFACDGSVVVDKYEHVRLSYASSSYEMAEQVKHLLLRFGIIASLRKKHVNYKDGKRSAYEVEVFGSGEIVKFASEIGIFGKEDKLKQAVKIASEKMKIRNWTHDTLPLEIWDVIKTEVGELSWAELYRRMNKPKGYNIHVGKRQIRRDTLVEIAKALQSQLLMQYATSDVFWDNITAIEQMGEEEVYDLTVDDVHNFAAGDMWVHNTAFSLNIAQYASVISKVPVGIFSLEMSKEELVDRMLVAQADIDAWRLKTGKLTQDDFGKLSEAMGVMAEAPLYIDDTPGISVLEMRTKARRLKSEHDLGLIVVDYLQLVKGRSMDNRVQEVAEISQGLKNLARELKVPVLALSQLSRAIENRGSGSSPQLSDLRESGSIEQDADVVMFLYREDPEDLESVKLNIAKHRNGALRTIDLRFRGERVKFYGVDRNR